MGYESILEIIISFWLAQYHPRCRRKLNGFTNTNYYYFDGFTLTKLIDISYDRAFTAALRHVAVGIQTNTKLIKFSHVHVLYPNPSYVFLYHVKNSTRLEFNQIKKRFALPRVCKTTSPSFDDEARVCVSMMCTPRRSSFAGSHLIFRSLQTELLLVRTEI